MTRITRAGIFAVVALYLLLPLLAILLYSLATSWTAHALPDGYTLDHWRAGLVDARLLRALGRDPLFQKRTRTDTLYGLVNLMDEARNAPKQIKTAPPILFLYGKKDQVIPAAPTQAVAKELGNKADVRLYENGYHMLLRDLQAAKVWRDAADWMLATKPGS